MKKILLALAIFLSTSAKAQTDTASQNITVLLPVKAVVFYSTFLSTQPSWADRKAPDYLITRIGSGTQPDSVVTVTLKAQQLLNYIIKLNSESYGVVGNLTRSIMTNYTTITGYTGLAAQITTKANGATVDKAPATWIKDRYNVYLQNMTDVYNQQYQAGIDFSRN